MIQSFKRPLIDEPTPLKALKGWTLERNIYALIKSRASNAIPARWRYFRAILGFLGLIFLLILRLSLFILLKCWGGVGAGGKRSFAWLLQATQAFWKLLSMLPLNMYTHTHTHRRSQHTRFLKQRSVSLLANLTFTYAWFFFSKRKSNLSENGFTPFNRWSQGFEPENSPKN